MRTTLYKCPNPPVFSGHSVIMYLFGVISALRGPLWAISCSISSQKGVENNTCAIMLLGML